MEENYTPELVRKMLAVAWAEGYDDGAFAENGGGPQSNPYKNA